MTTSVWLDEAGSDPRPSLVEDTTADVAIVGGGIAGVSAALALARSGARVVLVEERHLAAAASGRNAGFVLAGVAENFVAASRRYGEDVAWRVWRLTLGNQERLRALVAEHGIDCELAWRGSALVAGDDEEWVEIAEGARRLAARGIAVSVDGPARAAITATDGEIDPVALVRGLARIAESMGARIHEGTRATTVSPREVRTDRATIRAGTVLVCANAYTSHLVPARIRPVRGQMLATAPLARVIVARPTYAHRGFRYWRQRADGRLLVGGWRNVALDEEVGEDERVTERIQRELDAFARSLAPDAAITHRWAGIMGFSHDALPYVGGVGGLWVCGGFTGHGNAFAIRCAELVADAIRGVEQEDLALFAPDRP